MCIHRCDATKGVRAVLSCSVLVVDYVPRQVLHQSSTGDFLTSSSAVRSRNGVEARGTITCTYGGTFTGGLQVAYRYCCVIPVICSHDVALRSHLSAHSLIMLPASLRVRQYCSQTRQAIAHVPHTDWCIGEPRSRNSAAVAHRRAQSSSVVWCARDACSPPCSRQCVATAVHAA